MWSHPRQLAQAFRKLHRQFGHASKHKLIATIKAVYPDEDHSLLDKVGTTFSCETCSKFQRDGPHPVASLPKIAEFNVTVGMDLFYIKKVKVLHVIDMFTKFCRLSVVESTKSEEVVQKFHESWTSLFGKPTYIRFDLGPEFDNEEFLNLRDVIGCQLEAVGGGAHFAMGGVENKHRDLRDMVVRMCKDLGGCAVSTVLPEVNTAMNELKNVYGYSPAQLVFGFQPNLPHFPAQKHSSVEPGEEPVSVYRGYMQRKMEVLQQARKAYLKSMAKARMTLAMSKNQRPDRRLFKRGELVDYWCDVTKGYERWRGPARVSAVDDKEDLVFITSGGRLIRRHWMHVRAHQGDAGVDIPQDPNEDIPLELDGNEETLPEARIPPVQALPPPPAPTVPMPPVPPVPPVPPMPPVSRSDVPEVERSGDWSTLWQRIKAAVKPAPPPSVVEEEQGVQLDDGTHEELALAVKTARNEVRGKRLKEDDFVAARAKELKIFVDTATFDEIPWTGQQVISSRWVHTIKVTDEGVTKAKARLVARGFEDPDLGDILTASPTCGKGMWRLAVQILANRRWMPHCLDITSAFLNGEQLGREVYLLPPKGCAPDGMIWSLRRPVYGLSDAPRKWYDAVRSAFDKIQAKTVPFDEAFFYWQDDQGSLMGIVCVHVDDFYCGGTKEFQDKVLGTIRSVFPVGSERVGTFTYLGLLHTTEELDDGSLRIVVDQVEYVKDLSKVEVGQFAKKSETLGEVLQSAYRALVGALLWCTGQTRPDLAFDVATAASHGGRATYEDLRKLNAIVDKAKRTDLRIVYTTMRDEDLVLLGYADAAWANMPNGKTGGGWLVGLTNLRDFGIVSWRCRTLRRVVKSTLAGETLALSDLLDEMISVQQTLQLVLGWTPRTIARTDCRSLYDYIYRGKNVSEKRLHVELCVIKEIVKEKQCEIEWCETKDQLADCLPKHMVADRLIHVLNTRKIDDI